MKAFTYGGIYLAVGLLFAVFKWVLYSWRKAREFLAEQRKWHNEHISRIDSLQRRMDGLLAECDAAAAESRLSTARPHGIERCEKELEEEKAKNFFSVSSWHRLGVITVQGDRQTGTHTTEIDLEKLSGYVVAWATWWPAYAVLLLLNDFLKAVWDVVTAYLKRLFQAITSWAFKA